MEKLKKIGVLGIGWARLLPRLLVERAVRAFRYGKAAPWRRAPVLTSTIVLIGCTVAAGGYFAIQGVAKDQVERDLQRAAGEFSSVLTESFDRHLKIAEAAQSMFSGANTDISRWAFFEFASKSPGNHPGLRALEWIPRVPRARRAAVEKRAVADGLFDFRIVERSSDGGLRRARARRIHFPVLYVEPYKGNEAELGLDVAADPRTQSLLARARDSGKTVAARGRPSSGQANTTADFSIILPVYRSDVAPFTVRERRTRLAGFVRAVYGFDRLMASLRLGLGGSRHLEVYVLDRVEGGVGDVIFHHTSKRRPASARPPNATQAFSGTYIAVDREVAGWRWTVVVKGVPGSLSRILSGAAWAFVALSLGLTALLMHYLFTLREAKDKAEAANRAKSEFLAMMSHELRTPLNAVIGFAEMMGTEVFGPLGDEKYRQYAVDIRRSASHLLGVINNILDLSKIEADRRELEIEVLALSEIWQPVFSILHDHVENADVALHSNLSDSRLVLRADPGIFRQILLNLVSNAIKFTPQGGHVRVMADVDQTGQLVIGVADTGIGISKEDLDLVLEPFHQVDSDLARKYEGVGLGLPLSRRLVELHGGRLEIESTPGKGTLVRVTFAKDIIDDAGGSVGTDQATPSAATAPESQDATV